MRTKIYIRMICVGILTMVLTGFFSLFVFYNIFEEQIKEDANRFAQGLVIAYYNAENLDEFGEYKIDDVRITVVAVDGEVLFESDYDGKLMDNHNTRPEIIEARATGSGESVRESGTLGYDTYYSAILLDDGNVMRVALDAQVALIEVVKMVPYLIGAFIAVALISVLFTIRTTKSIIAPIEEFGRNLDNPDKKVPYKELELFGEMLKEHHNRKYQISKMRQEFTANVSHELKTPLTSISGYAELIINDMAKGEDIKKFAEKIYTEAARLIVLIGNILNLSELDEPAIKGEFEVVDIHKMMLTTADMLSLKAEKRSVKLTVHGESAFVNGNKMMLEELIYNLCDNSIRYSKNNGHGCVDMTVVKKEGKLIITIEDNGIGIAQKYQGRIFERFYRVDKSRSKETGGTGLGLAIVKHIVIQHEGKIEVVSKENVGTKMIVTLKEHIVKQ